MLNLSFYYELGIQILISKMQLHCNLQPALNEIFSLLDVTICTGTICTIWNAMMKPSVKIASRILNSFYDLTKSAPFDVRPYNYYNFINHARWNGLNGE